MQSCTHYNHHLLRHIGGLCILHGCTSHHSFGFLGGSAVCSSTQSAHLITLHPCNPVMNKCQTNAHCDQQPEHGMMHAVPERDSKAGTCSVISSTKALGFRRKVIMMASAISEGCTHASPARVRQHTNLACLAQALPTSRAVQWFSAPASPTQQPDHMHAALCRGAMIGHPPWIHADRKLQETSG